MGRVLIVAVWMALLTPSLRAPSVSAQVAAKPEPANIAEAKPDDVITNSIGMKLVYIKDGSFQMGSRLSRDEMPPHQVKITRSFYLGAYEVRQAEWTKVMGTAPWKGMVREGPDFPATYISWDDATKFCTTLTTAERDAGRLAANKSYRLSTEAEWEYACRAETQTEYSFGDDKSQLGEYAWYDGNTRNREEYAHAVGTRKANPWGLYDMHGNVYEWCSDLLDNFYYEKSPVEDPQGPTDRLFRVLRGGSWDLLPAHCRSARRYGQPPSTRHWSVGFRVLREL